MKRIFLSLLCYFIVYQAHAQVKIKVNLDHTYQTIEHFGASDAWSAQFVGNWPMEKKAAIAELLFSSAMWTNGQPTGIALTMWRFNIGAGSAAQAAESGIGDEWRRATGFLNPDGSYNWEAQNAQLWFLERAKKYGVKQFLAFVNSPPVSLTTNGKAFASGGKSNLSADKYDAYAQFLANVIKGVRDKTGITFDYISPVNEPQWDWSDGKQEGSPYSNSQIKGIAQSLNAALISHKLDTKIALAEAGQYNYLYSPHWDKSRGNQVRDFFNKDSPNYIGNLDRVDKVISAHSYFTTSPYKSAVKIREKVAAEVAKIKGLSFWQSEYCILGGNDGEISGNNRDLGIAPAIYVAKVIHNDLVNAQATAWDWWTALSPYNYKDGLIYLDKNKEDGKYYASKMLWAFGNYSRFVRPGFIRVEVALEGTSQEDERLLVSAYKDAKNCVLTTVIINSGTESKELSMSLNKANFTSLTAYQTSATSDLARQPVRSGKVVLAPMSITTVIEDISHN